MIAAVDSSWHPPPKIHFWICNLQIGAGGVWLIVWFFHYWLRAKNNKWQKDGGGDQQLIRTDPQLLLLSTPVNIFDYMNMLGLDKKVKSCHFAIIICSRAQKVNKESNRGAEQEIDLTPSTDLFSSLPRVSSIAWEPIRASGLVASGFVDFRSAEIENWAQNVRIIKSKKFYVAP